ncbi:heat shock 70 kDa protein, mitochondrial-like isoform X2 [Phragmites australis]|uniref:heat shock 70 kDa protein, mitochondrial-like isoform X2 n=1 Tax=Phragmites australis TaxID=29695 RepID=UPI002D787688|nr:heat shock 70 kDa protein, mitochondrial-like isoform X2 [Phragmites australis]XP_062188005.1 heat shock 70 kDa protein, mitochondrial-like isoform X2 [Phragmites australis]
MYFDRMHRCSTFSTMHTKAAIVGIDFGCKNSRVAIIDSLVPKVLESEIWRLTPSYVSLAPLNSCVLFEWALQRLDHVGGRVVVGEVAKRKMSTQPSDVVFDVKKLVGKKFDDCDIQTMRKRVHFSIIEGPKGEPWVEIQGVKFSPVEITSVIFAKLKDIVLMNQFHHKFEVVISVPVFFTEQQKEDIRSAGKRAGLDVLELIDETRAAALSSTTIKEGFIVVFGMGAGSYSVAILRVFGTKFEIKTQLADSSVGGDQFDDILVDYFVTQINKLHSVDIHEDKHAMAILSEAAEQAKVKLSSQPEVTVSIPYFTSSAQGPVHLDITISRPQFELLVNNLIEQIQDKCRIILKEASITGNDIGEIVFAGGMTRVPKVQETIYQVFGKHQTATVDPEEAVVIGSAIQAALVVEERREMSRDMIPLSIGIECAQGIFTRVIPRHTTLPTKRTVKIPSWCDQGECLRIRIFVGDNVLAEHNTHLGEVELISNRNCQGYVDFQLTFEVDKDYVVKVSARNADDQLEAADDVRKPLKPFPVYEKVIDEKLVSKHSVNNAVRKALLDWPMYIAEINAKLRNLARFTINTVSDVLSVRKDELPKDLREDALKAVADLQMALFGDVTVLKDKVLSAKSIESTLLEWRPPSESREGDLLA